MIELMPIASGSSGNCVYVGTDHTHLIIDAGASGKKTTEGLNGIGLSMEDIDGILITHEHIDHVKGLGVLSRRYGKPIYATQGTIDAILEMKSLGEIDESLFHPIDQNEDFFIKDMTLSPIPISHDAACPVAYIAGSGQKKAGVITDLGTYDDKLKEKIKDLDLILLEANHDVRMLESGKYPYPLKMRILSDKGHLSNEACGRLLSDILHDDIKGIFLGHLSHENNLPLLAEESVKAEIAISDTPYQAGDFRIVAAARDHASQKMTA